jgi:hypothetical protein
MSNSQRYLYHADMQLQTCQLNMLLLLLLPAAAAAQALLWC